MNLFPQKIQLGPGRVAQGGGAVCVCRSFPVGAPISLGLGQRTLRLTGAVQKQEGLDPDLVRVPSVRFHAESCLEPVEGGARTVPSDATAPFLQEGSTEPPLKPVPDVLRPTLPLPGAGIGKEAEGRDGPEGHGVLESPVLHQRPDLLQVGGDPTGLQTNGVLGGEEVIPVALPKRPEGLPKGTSCPTLRAPGPQERGQLLARHALGVVGQIDQESEGFTSGKGWVAPTGTLGIQGCQKPNPDPWVRGQGGCRSEGVPGPPPSPCGRSYPITTGAEAPSSSFKLGIFAEK